MSTIDYLAGRKILETKESKINGEVSVVKELAWGTYIKAGGLPQSGGLAKQIWDKSLRRARREFGSNHPMNVLILGFAGGGIAQIARKNWPECKIYGVDIDPVMVEMGRKYLGWETTKAKVDVMDADKYIKEAIKKKKKFDLICVDMYIGASVPEKFTTVKFIETVKKLQTKDGIVIYNRLYGSNDRGQAAKFEDTLKQVYDNYLTVYPAANIMFLCK